MYKQTLIACFFAMLARSAAFSSFQAVRSGSFPGPRVPPVTVEQSHARASALFPLFALKKKDTIPSKYHHSKLLARLIQRFDTLKSAGVSDALTAGPLSRIKKLHNPKTYLVLAALAGFRWDWCFRNPYYWFAVGFCIKWYRARYVFKIPVWDRQPNWNNIITSKEQEKDLKAYTCKNCGSTIFIAKTREFFFEGDTGIGGLGCFSCGAKGKDNFVMDRDRIVEDVADMDDYFEYERPLDFVSRAERRKLMKEAAGDEEKANQILMERQQSTANGDVVIDTQVQTEDMRDNASDETATEAITEETVESPTEMVSDAPDEVEEDDDVELEEETSPAPPVSKSEEKPPTSPKKASVADDNDIFDALDMDA